MACSLLYYLMERAILSLKFNLGNIFLEACYRCFVVPHKYFNAVAIVLWLTGSVHVHACSWDLHVTFSELCFGNA